MGRNNKQRRAAKQRSRTRREPTRGQAHGPFAEFRFSPPPSAPPPPTLSDQVTGQLARALIARGADRSAAAHYRELSRLAAGNLRAVCSAADRMLTDLIWMLWEGGWQPADLDRAAARRLDDAGRHLLLDAVTAEVRRHPAATVAPSWTAQLRQLGAEVWWSADQDPVSVRADRAPDLDRVWELLTELMLMLRRLPALELLDPLPGTAIAGNRDSQVDERILTRVRALLAKAESTTFPAEAESYTARAQELMARHSIDAALLAAAAPGRPADGPGAVRIGLDRPYETPKAMLLQVVADANRCRSVWSKDLGFATVVGFPADLRAAETIFTSLLIQSTRAMTAHGRQTDGRGATRTRSFRAAFLQAYALRIGERLQAVTADATANAFAESSSGRELVRVLDQRQEQLDRAVDELFGPVVTRSVGSRRVDHAGWVAGTTAAETADLGAGRAVTG